MDFTDGLGLLYGCGLFIGETEVLLLLPLILGRLTVVGVLGVVGAELTTATGAAAATAELGAVLSEPRCTGDWLAEGVVASVTLFTTGDAAAAAAVPPAVAAAITDAMLLPSTVARVPADAATRAVLCFE